MEFAPQSGYVPIQIGVVTYNSRNDIADCIEAIHAQSYPHIRLTVVDNASQDGTVDWLTANLPDDQLILNHVNRGFAAGHNQIIAHIGHAHYLALNPDTIMDANYVTNLFDMIQRRQAGWGIGKLYLPATAPFRFYSVGHGLLANGYAFNIARNQIDQGQFDEERAIFGAPGAAAFYTNHLIKSLGVSFFDEMLFAYGEDVDVDWRAHMAGFVCWYSPDALAYHRGGKINQHLQMVAIANRYLSAIKNACLAHLLVMILPNMIAHCLFRLLFTPSAGIRLSKHIIRYAPAMWKKRDKRADCDAIEAWLKWSEGQPGQYRTLRERLRAFWNEPVEN